MIHSPLPIGVAETPQGLLVSLPPRFWLVVSLRRSFRGLQAGEAPWTYLVPPTRTAARRIEDWIAEVELQLRAEARRRAWSAGDAEWEGAGEPAAPSTSAPPAPAETTIVTLPRRRTATKVLELLDVMARGAVLVAAVTDAGRAYRLSTTNRRIARAVAERVIRERLVLPGMDGLFGAEWSQTFRAPTPAEISAAQKGRRRPRKR